MKFLRWFLVLPLGIAIHFIIPLIYGSVDYFFTEVLELKHFMLIPMKYISGLLDIYCNYYTGLLCVVLPSYLAPSQNYNVSKILLALSIFLFFLNIYLLKSFTEGQFFNYFLIVISLSGSFMGNLKIKSIYN